MRHVLLSDISLIGRIVNDQTAVFIGVIHPALKLFFTDRRACRIIWKAEIDHIRGFLWKFRGKIILCRTGHVDHTVKILCRLIIISCSSRHNVGIYIYGVNRIAHSNLIIQSQDLLNISGVTFRSVRYEDFFWINVTAAILIIIFRNSLSQESVALIRRISVEGLCMSHLFHSSVKSLNDRRRQGLCHISDSQSDDFFFRIFLLICCDFFCNIREQIASRKLQIILINSKHITFLL